MNTEIDTQAAESILVAEDEAMVRLVAVETLRDAGFEVYEAADGQEALEVLKSNPGIALLISDIKMPRKNGYQLVAESTALRPALKVMLMTGYAQDPIPDSIVRAGIRVLYKPFNVDDLAIWAQQVLGKRV
jgi:CheY-like chemotaxis protein